MNRQKKIYFRRSHGFKVIIFVVIVLAAVQVWFLFKNYKEIIIKLPEELFASPTPVPVEELIVDSPYMSPDEEAFAEIAEVTSEPGELPLEEAIETADTAAEETAEVTVETTAFELNETQKKIVLRTMELLEEDIEYGYKVYPETGYPTENIWISTDVIAMVLNDAGYDLMELIYEDMKAHKEDYPMDIKNRSEPIKHIDFRDVFFQEQFFKRNALELENNFNPNNKDNVIQWQPGDIVYFQFDPDNPYQDLGGFISSRTNDEGVPLVIMISKEFGKVSEVDKLQEYIVVGHFRYPNPYEGEEG